MKVKYNTFFLIFLLFSCGSIKKDKNSFDIDTKTDANSSTEKLRLTDNRSYNLEPIDLSQPIVFTNSKGETERFTNTKVVYNNTHTIEKVKDTTSIKQKENISIDTKHKESDNTMIFIALFGFIFLFMIIVFFMIFWYVRNKINAFTLKS